MAQYGTRARRIRRIAQAMPIVAELTAHTTDVDNVWWARRIGSVDQTGLVWLTLPISRNGRGDEPLAESNYRVISADLEKVAAFGTDYRIDAWPGGTIHTLMIRADDALAIRAAEKWIGALADYPIADDMDFSAEEWEQNHPSESDCYSEDEECPCEARTLADAEDADE